MQTQSNVPNVPSTTLHLDLSPPCDQCGHPMQLRSMMYSARRQDITFVCLACKWHTTRNSEIPAG